MADERVKPCLRCDGLLGFGDSHCPSCGAFGVPAPAAAGGASESPAPGPSSRFLAEAILVGAGAALAAGTLVAIGL